MRSQFSKPDGRVVESAVAPDSAQLRIAEESVPRGGRASWRSSALSAAGVVLLVGLASRSVLAPPPVLPVTAQETEFSAGRALVHVRALAQAPAPLGSLENARRRQYIVDQLVAIGVDPEVQRTMGISTRFPVAGTIHNVIARIPGSGPGNRSVMLMAHYDGVGAGPGAADNAAGVAVLLESARALRAGPALRNDVLLLFTDGEESGMLGAAAFVNEHRWAEEVDAVFNFEARGTEGRSLMFETGAGNAELVHAFATEVPYATGSSLLYEFYQRMPNDTDFSETRRLGAVPGMNFAFIGGVERYHSPADDVESLDPRSLQHHGYSALGMVRQVGDEVLPLRRVGDAVFFNLPLAGMVTYPVERAYGHAGMAALLVMVVIAGGVAIGPLRLRGLAAGLAAAAGIPMLALLAGAGYSIAVFGIHGMMPAGGRPQGSAVYAGALILLTLAVVALGSRAVRRWAGTAEIAAGTLLLFLALAVAGTVLFPVSSYIFVWPTIAGGIALGIALTSPRSRWLVALRELALWPAAAAVLFIFVPLATLVFLGLQMEVLGGALIVLSAALAYLLLGWMPERWDSPDRMRLPGVFAATALLLTAVGLISVRHDSERPRLNQVTYLQEEGEGARWIAFGGEKDEWLRQFLGPAPAEADAADLVRAGLPSIHSGPLLQAPAPNQVLSAPEVTLLVDQEGPQGRILLLEARPPEGADALFFHVEGGNVRRMNLQGRRIQREAYRFPTTDWLLTYHAPPEEGIYLSFIVDEGELEIAVSAGRRGLPEMVGSEWSPRPGSSIPTQDGDRSWVSRRSSF